MDLKLEGPRDADIWRDRTSSIFMPQTGHELIG